MLVKIKVPPNMRKVRSNKMLLLPNVTMEPSNVWKKNKGITECDKNTVTCHVGTAQYEADTIKCEEKKIRESPNVTKV